MNSKDELELDRMLGEVDIDELILKPKSNGGVKSPDVDIHVNRDTERQGPQEGAERWKTAVLRKHQPRAKPINIYPDL